MNVLFVTYDFPYPTTSGGKNRSYHLLKYVSKHANVFLYSFVREDYNPESNEEILKLGVKSIKIFKRKKLNAFSNIPSTILKHSSIFKTLYKNKYVTKELREIIREENIDIVHYESTYTGFYVEELKKMHVRQVLGTENIEYQLYYDYAKNSKNFLLKPFIYQQASCLKKEELAMVKKADAVTVITNAERDLLKVTTGISGTIVANGIEPDVFSYSFDRKIKNNILFVGNFTYFPNIDAVNFFYENVYGKIKNEITFTIVGKKCNDAFRFTDKRIIKKDFVEDIIQEYKNSDILVFPIRIGGGTNFKILEAMSLGVPIVANPDRLAGLSAISGKHFLKAVTPDEYTEQIQLLYDDHALREKIAKEARLLIEENYRWEKIGHDLLETWKKVL